MIKLFCIICDNPSCLKVCTNDHITVKGKKRKLHYCSENCEFNHRHNSKPK